MSLLQSSLHPLLTKDILHKLEKRNIKSIIQFLEAELESLTTITGLTLKNISIIRKQIFNKCAAVKTDGQSSYRQLLKKTVIFSTGLTNLDKILLGGFCSGKIYEICGLPNIGKTQFCMKLLSKYIQESSNIVYYIDTKYDFAPHRIMKFVQKDKINDALNRIIVINAISICDLISGLHDLRKKIMNHLKVGLIFLDSLPVIFYKEENSLLNKNRMNLLVNAMRFIATEFHVIFIIINTITIWYEDLLADNTNFSETINCGRYWSAIPNIRLKFSSLEINFCEVEVLQSSDINSGLKCEISLN